MSSDVFTCAKCGGSLFKVHRVQAIPRTRANEIDVQRAVESGRPGARGAGR